MTADEAMDRAMGRATLTSPARWYPPAQQLPTGVDSIATKVANIMGRLDRIPQNGFNNFHRYKYTLESDLVDAIRPLMAEQHLMMVPDVIEETKNDTLTRIKVKYTLINGDFPAETVSWVSIGYGDDKGDKGAYKAMTGAMKYALMKVFMVSTGDDPERDTSTDERASQPQGGPITITSSSAPRVERGGRNVRPTELQLREISRLSTELGLGWQGVVEVINDVLNAGLVISETDPVPPARQLTQFLAALDPEDVGLLVTNLMARLMALDAEQAAEEEHEDHPGYS